MIGFTRWFPILPSLIGWAVLCPGVAAGQGAQVEVTAELERLMSVHGFEVRGIEQTAEASARAEGDDLRARLHALLEDFDHVIVQAPGGGIERVIILGEKAAYTPPPMVVESDAEGPPGSGSTEAGVPGEILLPTQRKGVSHLVTLSLEGPNKQRLQQLLLIDTGADQVVLPTSMIAPLGLALDALRNQKVQTANGTVEARVGTLPGLWLGGTRIADVGVAFIDDQQLGGNSLLGMSVLGRFRMTIDDEKNQLTLVSK